ncbi:uncharacterized protein LTR77_010872 [Saxophila tyrrhenica]|uniref:Uncharacterized protein n=1 Tax=Saxophila tyrrhenica TaxID=1690608 RepID=A0AAV9NYD9_9PEZI|nr:hypothetical protein LTR77_010872 [Saxophila tyrrhenica]
MGSTQFNNASSKTKCMIYIDFRCKCDNETLGQTRTTLDEARQKVNNEDVNREEAKLYQAVMNALGVVDEVYARYSSMYRATEAWTESLSEEKREFVKAKLNQTLMDLQQSDRDKTCQLGGLQQEM